MAARSLQRFVSRRRTDGSSLMVDDMRASVTLELPRTKGELTERDAISGARAHSGRSPPSPAWFTRQAWDFSAATLTAAEAEGSESCMRFARFISRTSLLTVELSGARAAA